MTKMAKYLPSSSVIFFMNFLLPPSYSETVFAFATAVSKFSEDSPAGGFYFPYAYSSPSSSIQPAINLMTPTTKVMRIWRSHMKTIPLCTFVNIQKLTCPGTPKYMKSAVAIEQLVLNFPLDLNYNLIKTSPKVSTYDKVFSLSTGFYYK